MVRGQARESAILTATLELLGEVGYQGLTLDAVAARARASKTTIYRRWPGKPELVAAALDASDAQHNASIPDTGSLRGDLIAVMEALRERAADPIETVIGDLVVAARRDPRLDAALREHVENDELSPFHEALNRAILRGELPAGVDFTLIHDVAEALILRQIHLNNPFDDAFVSRVVDDVLLVLLMTRRGDE